MIDKEIQPGISKTNIKNIERLTGNQAQIEYKKLLSPLVKDKELLDLLATEHNVQKFKNRLELVINIHGEGQILGTINKIGVTLIEATNDMKKLIKEIGLIDKQYPKILTDWLKENKYNIKQLYKTGVINNIHGQLIFRKAK